MKNYRSYTDNDLLHLLAKDDQSAFTELYDRYWKSLYVMAYKRLRSRYLSEDVIHDVLLSIWKNRSQLRIDILNNYLTTATKYAVMGVIKKEHHQQQYEDNQHVAGQELKIEDDLYYKQLFDLATREVNTLPEKCRVIFKYSREVGLSNSEIATTLNISKKTVENQMNKALHHLRFSVRRMLQLWF